ncbi:MAG TPA: hypothetical protein VHM88_23120 [Candidatus Acidoferrales bacterium]|nr:hypothetical protein [Candidatus Acidoferrales bacterium]
MSRSDPASPGPDPTKLTDEELQQLAEHMVDSLLSPSAAPSREGFSAARRNPALLKVAAESLGFRQRARDTRWLIEFGNALARKNRDKLLILITEAFRKDPPTHDQAQRLRRLDPRAMWRKGLLEVAELFKGARGIPAQIKPSEYREIAALGDRLTPACKKILADIEVTPNCSLAAVVEGCRREHPDAGTFLLRHLERLESALEDPELLNRAKKIDTQARLLADAMAGAEHDVTLRTSIERARTGRRLKGTTNP